MAHDLGDVVTLTFDTGPTPGVLANAGSVSLTIGLPDGTATSPAVTNVSTGRYRVDYPTVQVGRHTTRWVATGVNAAAKPDSFDVRPATPEYLVSFADTKQHLNLDGLEHDEELRGFIEAATHVVEHIVGPVVVRSVSEIHPSGYGLVLHQPPVLSLTSIVSTRTGAVYVVGDMDVDPATGAVRPLSRVWLRGPLRVTYTAGRRIVPASMTLAANVIIGHMWETQRGHTRGVAARPSVGGDVVAVPGMGFMIPRRALELLDADRRSPLVA